MINPAPFLLDKIILSVLVMTVLSYPAYAEMTYSGSNTLRLNSYHTSGDTNNSPYQFSGGQHENVFSLNARNRISAYELLDASVDATLDASDYLAPDDSGLLLDRMRVRWEKGDSRIPYRMEGGDIFIGFSPLTADISLKGAQLDLQPNLSSNRRDSIQLFVGTQQSDWQDLNIRDNVGLGGSWLFDYGEQGALSVNFVHNHRQGIDAQSQDKDQQVVSLAWLKPLNTDLQALQLEGELSFFNGDHDGTGGQNQSDKGGFLELSSNFNHIPLDYRLKLARYGQDFQPVWGNVSADQQTIEFYSGWRFESDHKLRLRILNDYYDLESGNKTTSRTLGINLSGNLPAGFAGSVDTYILDSKNSDSSSERQTRSIRLSAVKELQAGIHLSTGISWLENDDQTRTNSDSIYQQADVGLIFAVSSYGWQGQISPSLQLRKNKVNNNTTEVNTQLNLNLFKGAHDFSINTRRSERDYEAANSIDLNQNTLDARYHYKLKNHRFGLEYNRFNRHPDLQNKTLAWHVGLTWRYDFDTSATILTSSNASLASEVYTETSVSLATIATDLLDFVPQSSLHDIEQMLKASQPSFITENTNRTLAGLRLMPESQLEQKLLLINEMDTLKTAHLIFDLQIQSINSLSSNFSSLRNLIFKRYGLPDKFLEKGDFDNQIRQNLQLGEFIRVYQWHVPGGILRYGLPYRPDGKLVFELQYATQKRDMSDRDWGLQF